MKRVLLWLGIVVAAVVFLALIGCWIPLFLLLILLEPILRIGLGPILFLKRVVPQIRLDPGNVITALLCLILLAVGLHLFLRWLYEPLRPTSEVGWRWRWTLGLLGVVVLMFVAGTAAIGVTHQAAWVFRSPEPLFESEDELYFQVETRQYLKDIGLAFHNHQSDKGSLPPAGIFDNRGRGMHAWQTMLLPYLEQDRLYSRIDFHLPWDHPRNAEPFQVPVRTFHSPYWKGKEEYKDDRGYALTAYAGNSHVLGGDRAVSLMRLAQSPSGNSQIILAGEAAANYKAWGYPANWRDLSLGLNRSPDGFGSPGRKGVTFAMADGSVRTFTDDADPEFLRLLSQPDVDR